MKTFKAGLLSVVAAANLIIAGGCVSQEEYNKAVTMNRRANEQLQAAREQLRMCESEKADLQARLAERDAGMGARSQEIALLEAQNAELQRAFRELQELYNRALEGTPPRPIGPIVALPAPVDEALRAFATENPDLVEYLPEYGMVKFKSDFTFERGSDEVSANAMEALGKLVPILNSAAAANFHVFVAGHTDDIPIQRPETLRRHPTNWYLSAHRAISVQKVLEQAGLNPRRVGVMGFGEYHPIEPNQPGNRGNPRNRRVEIWIVPEGRFVTSSGGATAAAEPLEPSK